MSDEPPPHPNCRCMLVPGEHSNVKLDISVDGHNVTEFIDGRLLVFHSSDPVIELKLSHGAEEVIEAFASCLSENMNRIHQLERENLELRMQIPAHRVLAVIAGKEQS